MNSELCLWLAESCVCSGPRTKPKELEEIGIHARTIEQDLQTDSGNGNGSTYKIKQLFNKHGYNLAILRGHVKGNYFSRFLKGPREMIYNFSVVV